MVDRKEVLKEMGILAEAEISSRSWGLGLIPTVERRKKIDGMVRDVVRKCEGLVDTEGNFSLLDVTDCVVRNSRVEEEEFRETVGAKREELVYIG